MLQSITVKAASAEKRSEFIDDQTLQNIRRMAKQILLEKTPIAKIARVLKRTEGATRQKAYALGVSLNSRG
jgi:hypothetical protein